MIYKLNTNVITICRFVLTPKSICLVYMKIISLYWINDWILGAYKYLLIGNSHINLHYNKVAYRIDYQYFNTSVPHCTFLLYANPRVLSDWPFHF